MNKQEYKKPEIVELSHNLSTQGLPSGKALMSFENGNTMGPLTTPS